VLTAAIGPPAIVPIIGYDRVNGSRTRSIDLADAAGNTKLNPVPLDDGREATRINTSHDDLHARALDLSLRRDEPTIRDHTIFGIPLKYSTSPGVRRVHVGLRKRSKSELHLHEVDGKPDPPRPRYAIILTLPFLWVAIECLLVDLFNPRDIRPKALRVHHQQNKVYIGILARGSPSVRADQSDGPDFRLRGRPCQDGPDDMLDCVDDRACTLPLSSN
jgi:hypothetical protein